MFYIIPGHHTANQQGVVLCMLDLIINYTATAFTGNETGQIEITISKTHLLQHPVQFEELPNSDSFVFYKREYINTT